jgi:hypothetical protein
MFIGHFGLAFAAKKVAPEVSVGTTIFAAEFLDSIWPIFVLAGVERVEIAPGITRVTPLDFVYYPWSHSLAAAIAWGAMFAATYWLIRRKAGNALWLGLLVVSHWVLDWIVHRPDLPLYPGAAERHGLGLWNSFPATYAIEFTLFAAGIYLYLSHSRPRDRTGTIAFWALVALIVVSYLGATLGPPPPSPQAVAWTGLAGYLLVAWGWWIDKHREPVRQ